MNKVKDQNGEFAVVDQAASALPKDITPARDLWPDIAARLNAPERASFAGLDWLRSPILSVASLMIAASALTFALTRGSAPLLPEETAPAALSVTAQALDAGFAADRERLGRRVEARLGELPPELQGLVRQNLASIRDSAERINTALASDPGNTDLQDLLVATYQQELEVMTELAKIPATRTQRIEL